MMCNFKKENDVSFKKENDVSLERMACNVIFLTKFSYIPTKGYYKIHINYFIIIK